MFSEAVNRPFYNSSCYLCVTRWQHTTRKGRHSIAHALGIARMVRKVSSVHRGHTKAEKRVFAHLANGWLLAFRSAVTYVCEMKLNPRRNPLGPRRNGQVKAYDV